MDPINHRSFLGKAGLGTFGMDHLNEAQSFAQSKSGGISSYGSVDKFLAVLRRLTEWAYSSGKVYADPFNEVNLNVVFRDPPGHEQRVPAFWSGEQVWRIRFARPRLGLYTFRTISSDPDNEDLHGQTGEIEVSEDTGDNPLIKHGGVRVAADRRHFQHDDGTQFSGQETLGGWSFAGSWSGLAISRHWRQTVSTKVFQRFR